MFILMTVLLLILSMSVLLLAMSVYNHLKRHLEIGIKEELCFHGDPGIAKFYLDLFRDSIYTQRELSNRFVSAAYNEQNRQLYPYRYRHGATLRRVFGCEECSLVYLVPEESADLTYERLTSGKFKYHSWADINRYFLKCSFGYSKPYGCPAWKELRKILAVGSPDVATVCDNLAVRYEYDPVDGKPRTAYVGYADGAIGPIVKHLRDCCRSPFDALALCCQSCEFKRLARKENPVDGNPVGLPRKDGADESDDHGNDNAARSYDVAKAD